MKIISFILALLMAFVTYAHEPLKIVVSNDTTIYLRDALSLQDNVYLYGEKFNGEQKGGATETLFDENQVRPNKHINGITVNRDSVNQIYLSITVSEICGEQSLNFKYAIGTKKKNKNNILYTDWNPNNDDIQTITIFPVNQGPKVGDEESVTKPQQVSDQQSQREFNDIESLLEAKVSNVYKLLLVVLLVWFIALFVIVRVIAKKVDARVRSVEKSYQDEIENIKKQYEQVTVAIKNNNKLESSHLTFEDIRNYIDKRIAETNSLSTRRINRQQEIHINKPHINTSNKELSVHNVLSTDNVIYDMDSNTFRIGETDIKIFQIYSQGDEYFYNIIDNSNIREEFVSMIASYANCITIIDQGNLNAKSVEPVKAGRLIRNGNSFIVDQNNKLELRLI